MKRGLLANLGFGLCLAQAAAAGAQDRKNWPVKGVTIGAAPVGGVYYIWAGGPAKVLAEKLGIPASVESTGGPVHNTQLVQARELHFGMVTGAPAYEGWHGLGWAKGKKHQDLRVMFPMHTTYFQMYALKKSGIKSIKDLNGKSLGTGPVGGIPATYWPLILEAGGIKPRRIMNASSSSDLDNQVKDGLLDANGQSVGLPREQLPNLRQTLKKRYLFFPLATLVYYLAFALSSIIKAGVMAIVACVAVSWVQPDRDYRMGVRRIVDALAGAARGPWRSPGPAPRPASSSG